MPQLRLMTGPDAAGHGGEVFSVAYAPEGGLVLSGGWDGHLRLWQVDTGAQLTALHASPKAISACAVSPDGRQWFSGALDGLLSAWDAATHRPLTSTLTHTRPISTILFSPDGKGLTTASWDRTIGVWDRVREREGRVLIGHGDIVAGCRFTPDGAHLFSWSHDRTARVWDLARGEERATLGGHTDRLTAGAVSPDGLWAATGARDRVLTLWDLAAEAPAHAACLGGEVRACFFLPDGESLVSIDRNGRVVLHSVPDLRERQELLTGRAVQCAEAAPDARTVALGCEDGRVAFLAVGGLEAGPVLVTPREAARKAPGGWRRLFGGRAAPAYACTCPSCQHAFDLPGAMLGQRAACPACRRPLRVNGVARPA
ncbi:MAG TPA: WD40 repeat domain-containing protein [Gemmataceae bacterium]|nr:WD40 repeat domain-containing protein [Gemmataceae bacterium]